MLSRRISSTICRNHKSLRKCFSTEAKNAQRQILEEQTHVTKQTLGNTTITSIKYITSKWSNLNKSVKIGLGLYTVGIFSHNLISSYNAGSAVLHKQRQSNEPNVEMEWPLVYEACKQESCSSIFSSICWPVTLAGKFAPSLVMVMN
jgi:hypothetical protein